MINAYETSFYLYRVVQNMLKDLHNVRTAHPYHNYLYYVQISFLIKLKYLETPKMQFFNCSLVHLVLYCKSFHLSRFNNIRDTIQMQQK